MAIDYSGTATDRARTRARRAAYAGELSFLRRIDWLLAAAVAALVGYGLWAINGITHHDVEGSPHYFFVRQATFVAAGAVAFAIALAIDPSRVARYWRPLYGGTVAVMLLVFIAGPVTRGSQRWLDIGSFRFQPSEFGKLLFVLALAGFLAERSKRINEPRTVLSAVGLAAVPIALVFMQPDFGTALVYGAALAAVLLIAGTRWLMLAALAATVLVAAALILWVLPAAGAHVLQPYQVARITGFLHPDADPSGATYNIAQSKVTVGAGGLDGRGVAGATQTNLSYLPEHATDFVFASFAEQRGFFGSGGPPLPLPARSLAGLEDHHGRARPVLGHRRRRHCRRVPVPDLRQRRHDDGDCAHHRNSAPVRERRRLVDDRQPRRDGRAALDPRPRHPVQEALVASLSPGALFGVFKELKETTDKPLLVAGTLADQLARELVAGGEPAAVRTGGQPQDAAAMLYVLGDDVD